MRRICKVTHQGAAGQPCYVPLGWHLVSPMKLCLYSSSLIFSVSLHVWAEWLFHSQHCGTVCLNSFCNWTSPSDNSNDRLKCLCLDCRAAGCGTLWLDVKGADSKFTFLLTYEYVVYAGACLEWYRTTYMVRCFLVLAVLLSWSSQSVRLAVSATSTILTSASPTPFVWSTLSCETVRDVVSGTVMTDWNVLY